MDALHVIFSVIGFFSLAILSVTLWKAARVNSDLDSVADSVYRTRDALRATR